MAVVTSLANQPAYTVTKAAQTRSSRQKLTQRQLGDISTKVRAEVRQRSGGYCEVKKRCLGAPAAEQAHLIGRRIIPHKTTADDLRDACLECHNWLDQTSEGIRHRRALWEGRK